MFKAVKSPYLVPFNGKFKQAKAPTSPPKSCDSSKELKKQLKKQVDQLDELQRIFYAHDHHALLLIFQAMDAAGKDGTIRAVMSGINPAGCQVFSFKQPSPEELDHDFLWRTSRCLPERGRIGVFNRSYYEEVLTVRVQPEFLDYQKLPRQVNRSTIWEDRYKSIRDHEEHLARNGVVVLKFWLNVSKDEQRDRFLSRLNEPEKHWKFSTGDLRTRSFWPQYMQAYEDALAATSRPGAPWYAIPADNKDFMRITVAEIIIKTLESLDLKYPEVSDEQQAKFDQLRQQLEQE